MNSNMPMGRECSYCFLCFHLKLNFLQVFLSLCTLVTLFFAKEVPLAHTQHRLSDSAPLLDDHQINGSDLSKSKIDSESSHHTLENKSERHYTTGDAGEQKDQNSSEDSFSDSPGAVLVNLLTSLRHLPPAMHSVLVVMALTWVCVLSSALKLPCLISILIFTMFLFR